MSYFTTDSLQTVVAQADRSKPIFLVELRPLHDYGFVAFEDSNDDPVWVPCTVSEERYAISDNYKITLVPVIEGFGMQHFYQMDLASLIRSKNVLVLDQNIAWQNQVPVLNTFIKHFIR